MSPEKEQPVIQGERLRLRPLTREDLPRRVEMSNDREIQRLVLGVVADENTLYDMQTWFHMVSEDPYSEQWAIETADGRYIGDIDFHSIDPRAREGWISPMIGDKAYLDETYRRESLHLILRRAFRDKQLATVHTEIPDTDETGVALLQELGFRQVDAFQLEMFGAVQELTMTLRAEDFRAA